ncbi:MAG: hypothetical protein ACJ04P_09720, partial [Halioglobus sp.]
ISNIAIAWRRRSGSEGDRGDRGAAFHLPSQSKLLKLYLGGRHLLRVFPQKYFIKKALSLAGGRF